MRPLKLLAVVGLSSAQSTTTLFLPGIGSLQLYASVVGTDSNAATYAITCVDARTCGQRSPFTVTEGPATAHYSVTLDNVLASIDCSFEGTTSAFCTAIQTNGVKSTSITTRVGATELAEYYVAVTVTDKLPESNIVETTPVLSLTAAAKTTPAPFTSAILVGSVSTSFAASVSPSLGTESVLTGASRTSTAGVPQMTGKVGWVVGGMAVALAVVSL